RGDSIHGRERMGAPFAVDAQHSPGGLERKDEQLVAAEGASGGRYSRAGRERDVGFAPGGARVPAGAGRELPPAAAGRVEEEELAVGRDHQLSVAAGTDDIEH